MKGLDEESYDFVFIDKFQYFSKNELQTIISKKRLAPKGFSILSTDWGQHLYFKEKKTADYSFFNFKYSELGLNIKPTDILNLTINYRNTQEIGLFAHYFLYEDSIKMTSEENKMNHMYLNTMQSALRSDGRIPAVVVYKEETEIIEQIYTRIVKLVADGVEEKDIAVLFSEHRNATGLINQLTQKLTDHGYKPFSYLDDSNRKLTHDTNQVLLSTIHSSKGFEYKHVILCANHSFQTIFENTKRTFYVGLTRAQETLTVLAPFGTITDADEVDVVQHDNVLTEVLIAQFYFMPSSLGDLVDKEFEFPAPINDILNQVYSAGVPNKRKMQANYTNITATIVDKDLNKTYNEFFDDIIREGSILSIRKNIESGLVTIEMNIYEKDGTTVNKNIESEEGTESLKFIFGNNYVVYSSHDNESITDLDNVSDQVMKVKRNPKSNKWLVVVDLK